MIIKGSSLKVIDNSGAKWSKCIKVVGTSLVGKTGDLILVTLSNFVNRKKVKKRTIYLGLIAGVKFWSSRPDGSFFRFLLDKLLMTLLSFTEVSHSNI
jgi:large subunit ribosomal protein L14